MAERIKKKLYTPHQNESFDLSRSKIQLFLECQKCFYLDRSEKYRISRPSGPMSYIPTTIDLLLKKDFDKYRKLKSAHPYFKKYNLNFVPYEHNDIELWQNNRKGIRHHHLDTNFLVYGAIDDCWFDTMNNKIVLADYKTTAASYDSKTLKIKDASLSEKGAPHKYWYKKQIEIYSWIFQQQGFDISKISYFLFCSALYKNIESFDDKIEFKIDIIPYEMDSSWVEGVILDIKKILDNKVIPKQNPDCKFCNYRESIN